MAVPKEKKIWLDRLWVSPRVGEVDLVLGGTERVVKQRIPTYFTEQGQIAAYTRSLRKDHSIPEETRWSLFRVSWPVSGPIFISKYFDKMEETLYVFHRQNSFVYVPEDSRLLSLTTYSDYATVYLYGAKSHIIYKFTHLAMNSLSLEWFDVANQQEKLEKKPTTAAKGYVIGKAQMVLNDAVDPVVNPSVGTDPRELGITTFYSADPEQIYQSGQKTELLKPVNPLLLFQLPHNQSPSA